MRQLESSEWFKIPVNVEYIKADDSFDTHEQHFRLMVRLTNPLNKTKVVAGEAK
jgi:hypothetical protein